MFSPILTRSPHSKCPLGAHRVGQVRAPDGGAAPLGHLQRQRGRRVAARAVAPGAQHHHLHRRGGHGDAVADREGDGVVLGGEAGVPVEQDVARDVAEGEDVTWGWLVCVRQCVFCVFLDPFYMCSSVCRSRCETNVFEDNLSKRHVFLSFEIKLTLRT